MYILCHAGNYKYAVHVQYTYEFTNLNIKFLRDALNEHQHICMA